MTATLCGTMWIYADQRGTVWISVDRRKSAPISADRGSGGGVANLLADLHDAQLLPLGSEVHAPLLIEPQHGRERLAVQSTIQIIDAGPRIGRDSNPEDVLVDLAGRPEEVRIEGRERAERCGQNARPSRCADRPGRRRSARRWDDRRPEAARGSEPSPRRRREGGRARSSVASDVDFERLARTNRSGDNLEAQHLDRAGGENAAVCWICDPVGVRRISRKRGFRPRIAHRVDDDPILIVDLLEEIRRGDRTSPAVPGMRAGSRSSSTNLSVARSSG